jgi:superfamily II helicase
VGKKKLLKKLQDFFDADQREKERHLSDIKRILKKLKEKERKLQKDLELCGIGDKCEALKQELDIIYAQRMKGVKIVKEIKDKGKGKT